MGSGYRDMLDSQREMEAARLAAENGGGESQKEQLKRQGFSDAEIREREKMATEQAKQAEKIEKGQVAPGDPYGGSSTQSIRRRGSTTQQRVGTDTRARGAGEQQSGMGSAMMAGQPETASQPATMQTSAMWQAQRQPVDLASIQSRLLQSFKR